MIINSVVMHNFKSHAETRVDFGRGINVILGENGAGKTSVLEAVSFGLFKDYSGSIENLVRSGEREMSVDIEFTSHGRRYRVVRRRTKSTTDSKLFLLDGNGKELRSGDAGVDEEIASILGIDKYLFSNAIYVRQGEIERLLTEAAHRRKQLIAKLLGIEVLERVWESMRPVTDRYRDKKARLEGEIMREDEIEEQKSGLSAELSEVRERMAKTKKTVEAKTAEIKKAESEEKRLSGAEGRYAGLSAKREELTSAVSRESERLEAARKSAEEAGKSRRESEALGKKIAPGWKAELDRKIDSCRQALSGIDVREGSVKGRIDDAHELKRKLEGASGKCPLCDSKLTEGHRRQIVAEREAEISRLEKDMHGLAERRKDLAGRLEDAREKREEVAGLEKRLSELSAPASRYDETAKAVRESEKALNEMRLKLDDIEKQMAGLESERKACVEVREKIKDMRSELDALRGAYERQEGRLGALGETLERLEQESKAVKEKRAEHGKLAGFIKILGEIRSIFDKSGLQLQLRKRAVPVIENHIRSFFREFNFEYSDISLSENYDITLYGPGGESNTEMMSGGERIAAALALRLGIARALAGPSAETVMLDEPTIFLDEQRRQDLIEVLKKTSVIPQMIVVTHDTAMEDAADSMTVIKKRRGVSSAE